MPTYNSLNAAALYLDAIASHAQILNQLCAPSMEIIMTLCGNSNGPTVALEKISQNFILSAFDVEL